MYYWQSNAEETTTYVEMDSYQSQLFVLHALLWWSHWFDRTGRKSSCR